jgi:hypothetical protein
MGIIHFQQSLQTRRMRTDDAQRQLQWHKRMNAHSLNQSGKVISDKPLKQGNKVYF